MGTRGLTIWKWTCCLALLLALGMPASAQVTARIDPPKVVVGDTFRYVIEAGARFEEASLPKDMEGEVKMVSGPNSSTSMQYINGRQSMHVEMSWTFQAQSAGPIKFGPAQVVLGGKTLQTNAVEAEAIPVPSQKVGTLGDVSSARTGNAALDGQLKGRLFSYTEIPGKIYANQAFQARTYLYRKADFNPSIAGITLAGMAGGRQFIRVDDASFRVPGLQWESVKIDGEAFLRAALEVSTLVPTRAGKTTLHGTAFQIVLQTSGSNRQRDPFFDSFFNRNLVEAQLPAYEQEVEISPLPEKPEGAIVQLVGNYQITSFADKKELSESDLLTLTIRISGTGYLQTVSMDGLPEFDGFSHINEEVDFQINEAQGDLITTKTFKEIVQANKPGEFEIPGLPFAVFNPKTEEQRVVSTQPIKITVNQAKDSSLQLAGGTQSLARGEVREVGKADILFIDTAPIGVMQIRSTEDPFYARPWYWILHGVALLLAGVAVAWTARARQLRSDPLAYRARLAERRAHEALKGAERLKEGGSRGEFYSALAEGMLNCVAAITGREAAGLTAEEALAELRRQEVGEESLGQLRELLDRCDMMRYAPESSGGDRESDLRAARALIGELGRQKR